MPVCKTTERIKDEFRELIGPPWTIVSLVPLGFKRIILFDVNQLYVEKSHQTIIFPSLCFAKV
jgi:hypothetical protein